jgi:hypothetical protein
VRKKSLRPSSGGANEPFHTMVTIRLSQDSLRRIHPHRPQLYMRMGIDALAAPVMLHFEPHVNYLYLLTTRLFTALIRS